NKKDKFAKHQVSSAEAVVLSQNPFIPPTPSCENGEIPPNDPSCQTPSQCGLEGKEHLLASDSECSEPEPLIYCNIIGKENLLANDPSCAPSVACSYAGKSHLLADDPACSNPTCELSEYYFRSQVEKEKY